MAPLIRAVLQGIDSDEEEAFLGAGEIIRAHIFGTAANVGLIEPYSELLRDVRPTVEEIEMIKDALIRYLRTGVRLNVCSALNGLSELRDPALIPFLREQLQYHLSLLLRQNAAVGNLICALDNVGEEIISEGCYSLEDVAKNICDARAYLANRGVTVSW